MQLPSLFHGRYRDVKRNLQRIVRRIVKRTGEDWIALIEEDGLLDVETTAGLIVLKGPSPLIGSQAYFQTWLLWSLVRYHGDSICNELVQEVFERSLTRPWATLGLLARGNNPWLYREERFRPFLRAVREYWELYAALGPRYTNGQDEGEELWSLPSSLSYVLANLRIPVEELNSPLPPGGIGELIDRTEGVEPIKHPVPGG